MKKLLTLVIIVFLLHLQASAQSRKPDRQVDGFKGNLRSVVTERCDLKRVHGKFVETPRKMEETITYNDKGSRLTWKSYDYLSGTLFDSVVYRALDGDKVAVYEDVKSPAKITTISPVNSDESHRNVDSRYTYKFRYKYDNNGDVTEEAWHQNDDTLWLRYTYKFLENKIEELVFASNGSLNQKIIHILDNGGNETERLYYDVDKNSIESKETYEYLEFDRIGNWTKKQTSEGNSDTKFVQKPREIIYRTLKYF